MNESIPYANSIFEQPWWLDAVAPGLWSEVIVKDGEETIARMPYVMNKRNIYMPHLTQTLGPWIDEKFKCYKPGNTQLNSQKELIGELFKRLPKYRSLNVTLDSSTTYVLPYGWMGFKYIPFFSYRIKNLTDIDVVYENFGKTVKKNIKTAGNKVDIIYDTEPTSLLELLEKTFALQNRKLPIDRTCIKAVVSEAMKRQSGNIIIAKDKDGVPYSGAFIVYDDKVCYYLLGGTDPEYRSSGAQSLVLWEAIKHASKTSKVFDFEGSMIEGIENFFRQFGGEQVINYSITNMSLYIELLSIIKPRIKRIIGYKM